MITQSNPLDIEHHRDLHTKSNPATKRFAYRPRLPKYILQPIHAEDQHRGQEYKQQIEPQKRDRKPNYCNRFRLTTSMVWDQSRICNQREGRSKILNQRHEHVATWNKNKRWVELKQCLFTVECCIGLNLHCCTFADKSEFKVLPNKIILKAV